MKLAAKMNGVVSSAAFADVFPGTAQHGVIHAAAVGGGERQVFMELRELEAEVIAALVRLAIGEKAHESGWTDETERADHVDAGVAGGAEGGEVGKVVGEHHAAHIHRLRGGIVEFEEVALHDEVVGREPLIEPQSERRAEVAPCGVGRAGCEGGEAP